jgi:RHS repeat-associated protein
LTYDNNGNMLVDQNGTVYTYDAWNRMATATPHPATDQETYTYNALGEQVTQTNQLLAPVFLIINDGSAQRAMITSITLYFAKPLSSLSSTIANLTNAISLTETGVGSVTFASITNNSGDHQTFSITFKNTGNAEADNCLADGAYTLVVNHSDITFFDNTTLSADQTFTFYRLYGDYTGSGQCNSADFNILASEFNQTLPANLWYIAPTENLLCNSAAFNALAANFNQGAAGSNSGNILSGPFANAVLGPGDIVLGLSGAISTTTVQTFYYSSQWQVIQDDSQLSPSATPQIADQYVWGQAYVNELVLRDRHAGNGSGENYGIANSGLDERLYALQDANWNVTTLIDTSGNPQERFTYDPYGNATVLDWQGIQPTTDQYNWVYMFQGGRVDLATGLYTFQHRNYSPVLGTWVEQDPAGYVDGPNMYQYVLSNPTRFVDPTGTEVDDPGGELPKQGGGGERGYDYGILDFPFPLITAGHAGEGLLGGLAQGVGNVGATCGELPLYIFQGINSVVHQTTGSYPFGSDLQQMNLWKSVNGTFSEWWSDWWKDTKHDVSHNPYSQCAIKLYQWLKNLLSPPPAPLAPPNVWVPNPAGGTGGVYNPAYGPPPFPDGPFPIINPPPGGQLCQ